MWMEISGSFQNLRNCSNNGDIWGEQIQLHAFFISVLNAGMVSSKVWSL
jgi:hypothetical protein